ncbi:MAG: hypothetical protein IT320_05670 [Anaerolineae bacterium]|nr:hypothetical protein [Anaerolineae bacterium]
MITFKLWRSLRSPALIYTHPLFKQTVRQRHRSDNAFLNWDTLGVPGWVRQIVRFLLLALVTLLFVFLVYVMVFLVLFYIVFSLLLSGAIWGVQWSTGIASLIARERERRTHDLLAVTPTGAWGIAWIVSSGYIHADQAFRTRTRRFRVLLWGLVIALAGMIVLSLMFDTSPSPYAENFFWAACAIILTGMALHFELMASLVSAVLIGMLASTFASRRIEASMVALALFAGLQLTYLFLIYVSLLVVLPQLATTYGLYGFSLVAIFTLFLVGLGCLREIANQLLWRVTQQRVGAIDESMLMLAAA